MEEFPTDSHLYYALSRSLRNGSSERGRRRPRLPIEIVIKIFDMAGFIKSIPSKSREILSTLDSEVTVRSSGPKESKLVIQSPPLTREVLQHIRQLQVETISHDQGWATGPGSWTWFEVVILTPVQEVNPAKGRHF
jgi:hypothetical protein